MADGEQGRTRPRDAGTPMTVEEDPPETVSRRTFVKAGVAVAVGAWAASFGGSLLRSATTEGEEEAGVSKDAFVYHVPAGEKPWYAALDGMEVLADEFPPMESAKVFVRGVKAVLMRLDESLLVDRSGSELGFVAFESKCTHLGCQVYFTKGRTPVGDYPDGIIYCPCHQGSFDPYRGAKVVSGPPPQPLPRIPLRVVNGRLEAE
jgi:rieske iron-sulfur protein